VVPRGSICYNHREQASARSCRLADHVAIGGASVILTVDVEQETDGRWIAEITELPGVLAYGRTAQDARAKAQALALRVLADRLEHGEAGPDLTTISFAAA
jgi:predicted RNase H-like HicB family nuclease